MTNITDNFDWVTARNKCSIRNVFETLRLQVENDIKIRNESLTDNERSRYSYGLAKAVGGFSVYLEGIVGIHQSVLFSISEKGSILVHTEDGVPVIEGKPTVCDDGKCRLKVNGQERELWQVRKIALEDLFFHKY